MGRVVIFGAGGTAGHVFMARGIAYHLKERRVLVTDLRGSRYACDCRSCIHKSGQDECELFDEIIILPIVSGKLRNIVGLVKSVWRCVKLGWKYKRSIYIGCGAYVSIIAGIGCLLGLGDIYLYQGDQVPGLANRVLQWLAKICWVSCENIDLRNKKTVGCVVRHNILPEKMKNDGRFRVLVLGSSVGSSLAHKVLPDALELIDSKYYEKLEIIHQIQSNYQQYAKNIYEGLGIKYFISDYIDSAKELPRSTVVIGRAGWSLLSDLIASKRAAIIVPWSGAKDNHQYYNALWFCKEDLRWLMQEKDLTKERLAWFLGELIQDVLEQNIDSEYINNGILAERSKYIGYSSQGGEKIASFINKIC